MEVAEVATSLTTTSILGVRTTSTATTLAPAMMVKLESEYDDDRKMMFPLSFCPL